MSNNEIEITDAIERDLAYANSFEFLTATDAINQMIANYAKDLVTATYRPYIIERLEHWAKVLIINEREEVKKELLKK